MLLFMPFTRKNLGAYDPIEGKFYAGVCSSCQARHLLAEEDVQQLVNNVYIAPASIIPKEGRNEDYTAR